ncbi:ArsR family transcriptional regulator [Natrinema zhouii]|uniref:ArsR family transcriptional regulator n=1 Tax=Natrinema zhouii TaxID=1710539 RepID=A0A7D6CQS6_9EURY|nr:ArsR family transcriptional regulator [Natrinema zhouii]QLK26714.1 ArsR family transcriptional regulator [Natrinema zhouii]
MGADDSKISDVDPFPETETETEVNDAAEREWTAATTAFERVESVLGRTTDWQSASEIADRARVSEPTARKHLTALAETGHAATRETGNATRFRRNPDRRRLERVQRLADDHSRGELERSIREMKARIRAFEDAYEATSPEELVDSLEPDDEDGWNDLSRWKTTRRNLAFAKTALSFTETRLVDSRSTGEERAENA